MTPLAGDELAQVSGARARGARRSAAGVRSRRASPAWEAGWGDIQARFAASGDLADLEPHYFRKPSRTMRVLGRYVRPHDARFEASFVRVLQTWIAARWLDRADAVYEFGCGPGHNVVAFAQLLPGRPVLGLDWARPSQEILRSVAERTGLPVAGRRFDMFAPDPELVPAPRRGRGHDRRDGAARRRASARSSTSCSRRRPRLCVHLEPLHELYDRANPFDDAAARYAERRGYLRGYLPRLEALARAGRIELLCVQRHLGSEFHDGWGSLVWRPLTDGQTPQEQRR